METITPKEFKSRIKNGEGLVIIDVREEWEFEEQNIGARLIPLATLPTKLHELDHLRSSEIIVHCKSGKRSHQARKYLTKQGFSKVRSLEGGIEALLSSGYSPGISKISG